MVKVLQGLHMINEVSSLESDTCYQVRTDHMKNRSMTILCAGNQVLKEVPLALIQQTQTERRRPQSASSKDDSPLVEIPMLPERMHLKMKKARTSSSWIPI
jgi:hypothetical protein